MQGPADPVAAGCPPVTLSGMGVAMSVTRWFAGEHSMSGAQFFPGMQSSGPHCATPTFKGLSLRTVILNLSR